MKINNEIRSKLNLQQWRSTQDTIEWFNKLSITEDSVFIQLDIEDFYPSISRELFDKALDFASKHFKISQEEKDIILNSRKSLLFNDQRPWIKKTGEFDVTMGAYDACELCELVGLLLIYDMRETFPSLNFGLYRDDGAAEHKKLPGPQMARLDKDIKALFKKHGLTATVEMEMTVMLTTAFGKY